MSQEFKPGDRVQWNTSQGKTIGTIRRKLTEPINIGDHHVAASQDNPEYLVESNASGKLAAHRPDALTRVEG